MKSEWQFLQDLNYVRVGSSKEELKAAQYIKEQLEALGLKAEIEPFKTEGAEVLETKLEVVKPYKQEIKCKGYSNSLNVENLQGELYYYRGKDNCSFHDVKDKIVLFDRGLPYWSYKELIDNKAKGFIVCNGNLTSDSQDIDERNLREPLRELGVLPGVAINVSSAFDLIKNKAEIVSITSKQKEFEAESRNVICEIEGETKETIIFTAHYDSTALSNGMYDNATGSVGIFKIAEYYATHKPHRTLIFVFCGSEEKGLLGSKAYVKEHNLDDVKLCINLDMIGTVLGGFLACCTSENKLVNYIDYFSKEVGFSIYSYQGVYSSDSTPFADKGVPAVSFARITDICPIHCRYDQIDILDEDIIKQDIQFILDFTKRMVDAKVMPVNKEMPDNMKEELDYYLLRKKKINK